MPIEEPAGAGELRLVEVEEAAVAAHQWEAAGASDPIARGIARDGPRGGRHDDADEREVAGGGQGGRGQKRRLARQREAETLQRHQHEDPDVSVALEQSQHTAGDRGDAEEHVYSRTLEMGGQPASLVP